MTSEKMGPVMFCQSSSVDPVATTPTHSQEGSLGIVLPIFIVAIFSRQQNTFAGDYEKACQIDDSYWVR